jgi:hypothetical protein
MTAKVFDFFGAFLSTHMFNNTTPGLYSYTTADFG